VPWSSNLILIQEIKSFVPWSRTIAIYTSTYCVRRDAKYSSSLPGMTRFKTISMRGEQLVVISHVELSNLSWSNSLLSHHYLVFKIYKYIFRVKVYKYIFRVNIYKYIFRVKIYKYILPYIPILRLWFYWPVCWAMDGKEKQQVFHNKNHHSIYQKNKYKK
jgi:hypothetical protein